MSTDLQNRPATLDPAACWDVLQRVASTPSLKRAARLREFLLYVGAKSIHEGRSHIHEQEIGETVFGRPQSYDTSQDNIVRVSATELRKRVDAYFTTEGSSEPIIFEIPRGSYLPAFRPRDSMTLPAPITDRTAQPPSETATPASQTDSPQRRILLWIISAVALLLALACIVLLHQNATLRQRIQTLEHQHSMSQPIPANSGSSAASLPTASS